MKKVSWFSAGVSSAVATKIALDEHSDLEIIYNHIDDQHEDTMRFVKDCEQWFQHEVKITQSRYKDVDSVLRAFGCINFVRGAKCTSVLKKRVRQDWEAENLFFEHATYFWGIDPDESHRTERIEKGMPEHYHVYPLIEHGISKENAHGILLHEGIKRPVMYDLGFPNNNCLGCVKGGKGYWNLIRVIFPDVFAKRAKLERDVGYSCINGVFLDELQPDAGRDCKVIVEDCGIFCELGEEQ